MAAGDFAGKVLRMTAGVVSEIDPKNTLKIMSKEGMENLSKTSGAFKTGKNVTNFLAGGIKDTVTNMSKKNGGKAMKFGEAIKAAHSTKSKIVDPKMAKQLGKKVGEEVVHTDMKKVAGTVMGIGLAGRVVTGGGIYRDQHGKANLPGVPFI